MLTCGEAHQVILIDRSWQKTENPAFRGAQKSDLKLYIHISNFGCSSAL